MHKATHCSNNYLRGTCVPKGKSTSWLKITVYFIQCYSVNFVACSTKSMDLNWLYLFKGSCKFLIEMTERACYANIVLFIDFFRNIKGFEVRGLSLQLLLNSFLWIKIQSKSSMFLCSKNCHSIAICLVSHIWIVDYTDLWNSFNRKPNQYCNT